MRTLIVGQTTSGKTSFCRKIIEGYKNHNASKKIIVYDTFLNSNKYWNTTTDDIVTDNEEEFIDEVYSCTDAIIIVDEAGLVIGSHPSKEMIGICTNSRHYGHNVYIIGQRAQQINNTMRCNCSALVVFSQSKQDCKLLANDFNCPAILEAQSFKQGEYLYLERLKKPVKGKLF